MTTVVTILTEGFADWETALLNGVARSYYNAETRYASPGGRPVRSAGGLRVTPDLALEAIDLEALDVLVVCGGSAWQTETAPDLTELLLGADARGKVVGAICDGTVAAARSGLLDEIDHTSNGPGYLDHTGYKGRAHYRDLPGAVASGNVVTAPGTAPVSFMAEIMRAAGLADGNLDYYLGLHAAEHRPAATS
mgnify:CR=1 FL=1